jgi:hypothetical protein
VAAYVGMLLALANVTAVDASLIVSLVALGLSVVSIGWQAWTWRRSGAVVKVTASQSFPVFGSDVGDPHVSVTATNKGRSPVTVNSWGFETPTGNKIFVTQPLSWSTPLEHRLEPGTEASWYAVTEEIVNTCRDNGVRYQDLRAWVRLGTGRRVYSRKRGIGWK